jgi:hypothetical protein
MENRTKESKKEILAAASFVGSKNVRPPGRFSNGKKPKTAWKLFRKSQVRSGIEGPMAKPVSVVGTVTIRP